MPACGLRTFGPIADSRLLAYDSIIGSAVLHTLEDTAVSARLSVTTNSLGHPITIRLPRGKQRRVLLVHRVWDDDTPLPTGYRNRRRLHEVSVSGLGRRILVLDHEQGAWEMREP